MIEINKLPHLKLITPEGERLVIPKPEKTPNEELREWRGALGILQILLQKGVTQENAEYYAKVSLGRIIALKEKGAS